MSEPSHNDSNIKVSVIMPIYNAYDYLRPAMDSVLDQTLSEIEVICVDDGSTDHSLQILKEYQEKDPRVRIVTEANAGPALARNNGMHRARGEFLIFLDADDFFELTLLEKLYRCSVENDLDIAIAGYDHYISRTSRFVRVVPPEHSSIYSDMHVTSKNEYPDVILSSTVGSAWNKLFRRSFVEAKELSFLPDVKVFEDVYFTVTALSLAERITRVPEVLIHHRIYSEQSRNHYFRTNFTQIPAVYAEIRATMTRRGMYAPLSVSFLNLTASRCYKIYNLLGAEGKKKFWEQLHNGDGEKLGWYAIALDKFDDPEVCAFVANVHAFTHERYIRRVAKGLTFRLRELTRSLADQPGFFSRIFGKKKKKTR